MWFCYGHCHRSVNEASKTGFFPDGLKCGNVRPIHKKVDSFDKNQWVFYHFY